MVAVLYTSDGGASMYAGWLSCMPSAMINFDQIVTGSLAEPIGKTKYQFIAVLTVGGALLTSMSIYGFEADVLIIGSGNCRSSSGHEEYGY